MRRNLRRLGGAAAVGAIVALLTPGIANADAAGPTDYRTDIDAIVPASDAIELAIEGGDAFMSIDVEPGHRVVVVGYDDEPYLLVDADGDVFQNRRSFATYYNEDRFGSDDIPAIVDNDAEPDWERIGSGGTWAWHDHRAHWMGAEPPIGLEPGDSLPAQVVPIEIDGVATAVTVRTTLVEPPSFWPAAFGLVLGIGLAMLARLAGPATMTLVTMLLAAGALWVGIAQFRSLPPSTGPLLTWWLLPALALACGVVIIAIYGWNRLVEHALLALAGLQLVLWAYRRRSGLTHAIVPTDLPFWFDRTMTAIALSGGATIAVVAVGAMLTVSSD